MPPSPQTLVNQAMAEAKAGNWQASITLFDKVIKLAPKDADAYYNRGIALRRLEKFREALVSYDKAIALRPDHILAHTNRGVLLEKLRRYDEALAAYDKALELKPDFAEVHSNRGFVLDRLNRYDEAVAACDRAIALKADYSEAWNNRGLALEKLKRYDEALASYDKAIALAPDHANAYWNKALLAILLGRYEEGWKLYEWRWKKSNRVPRIFEQPLWLGKEPLKGKTILLYPEQGLGDVIQFCRYVPAVEALGAEVILEVPAPLVLLLSTLIGSPRMVAQGSDLPAFDLHCPLLSLPLAFGTTLDTVPAEVPYLFSEPSKHKAWQEILGEKTKPRIGVAWSGNAHHINDHNRSIAPDIFTPLLDLPCEFHLLHKELSRADRALLAKHPHVSAHADRLKDFSDTAALIEQMDVVIAVDTAVAHLSGALGKQVKILLPFAPDYRWMTEREDSPWYPTARLIRQETPGDWAGVIAKVVAELQALRA